MKITLIALLFSTILTTYAQERNSISNTKRKVNNVESNKIKTLIKELNSWDKEELDLNENTDSYQENLHSGETADWVDERRRLLSELGVFVIWNKDDMEYQRNTEYEIAVRNIPKIILNEGFTILETSHGQYNYVGLLNNLHRKINATNIVYKDSSELKDYSLLKRDQYYILGISDRNIIKGDLNGDSKIDFAIRSFWDLGYMGSNAHGHAWYIFISSEDQWTSIKNPFGGYKVSRYDRLEDIISISNNEITTVLTLNEDDENKKELKYKIENNKLIQVTHYKNDYK